MSCETISGSERTRKVTCGSFAIATIVALVAGASGISARGPSSRVLVVVLSAGIPAALFAAISVRSYLARIELIDDDHLIVYGAFRSKSLKLSDICDVELGRWYKGPSLYLVDTDGRRTGLPMAMQIQRIDWLDSFRNELVKRLKLPNSRAGDEPSKEL